jgi:hypothetical protein
MNTTPCITKQELNKLYPVLSANKRSKYNAVKTISNGIRYDSKKEAAYSEKLELLRSAKDFKEKVIDIQRQVPFTLAVNDILVCKYILDFEVKYGDGRREYIDVKGMKSGGAYQVFLLKKKLMYAVHGIVIKEI